MFIYEVYICLPIIKTKRQTTAPFKDTTIISSSDHQKKGLYQGSADRCEGDRNSDIIRLIYQSQAIHYCNQSVLAIVPDLNIFIFIITIFDLILISALVRFSLLSASYLYNLKAVRSTSFVWNQHCILVIAIVTSEFTILILQKYRFKVCAILFGLY